MLLIWECFLVLNDLLVIRYCSCRKLLRNSSCKEHPRLAVKPRYLQQTRRKVARKKDFLFLTSKEPRLQVSVEKNSPAPSATGRTRRCQDPAQGSRARGDHAETFLCMLCISSPSSLGQGAGTLFNAPKKHQAN